MKTVTYALFAVLVLACSSAVAKDAQSNASDPVSDQVIAAQRHNLAENTKDEGFGPQTPRNIDSSIGSNKVIVTAAPSHTEMNLCNIHFHKNAEHAGGEFTKYAGNGDGHGYHTGYQYAGTLTRNELAPIDNKVCPSKNGSLHPGDTIETHYVYSNAQIKPGPTLGSCLSDSVMNPQLRVVAQVYVLTNDSNALDFSKLAAYGQINGYHQALGIPDNTGSPVEYAGSTTGPSYNEKGSPIQATWEVHPKVAKVNIATVGEWCKGNVFDEDHAHGVRNLIINPDLLSSIAH